MRGKFVICFVIVAAIAMAAALNICNAMFSCGCSFADWDTHCNVHNANPPHCPWCAGGNAAFIIPLASALAATGLTIYIALARINPALWFGLLAGIVSFPIWAMLAGLASGLIRGYPTFFGLNL